MLRKLTLLCIGVFCTSLLFARTTRILVILGGHSFDKENFQILLEKQKGFEFILAWHPDTYEFFKPKNWEKYDIILQYDMNKGMPEEARNNYIQLLKKGGKGVVVLHHSFCGNEDFPEYRNIIGGQYFHSNWIDEQGRTQPPGKFQHDVQMNINILDRKHPITKGVHNFTIIDELYSGGYIASSVHPLIGSNTAGASQLGWCKTYGKSKIVTLLLGHDKQAWENPNFIKLLHQSLKWVKK